MRVAETPWRPILFLLAKEGAATTVKELRESYPIFIHDLQVTVILWSRGFQDSGTTV